MFLWVFLEEKSVPLFVSGVLYPKALLYLLPVLFLEESQDPIDLKLLHRDQQ